MVDRRPQTRGEGARGVSIYGRRDAVYDLLRLCLPRHVHNPGACWEHGNGSGTYANFPREEGVSSTSCLYHEQLQSTQPHAKDAAAGL